MPVCPACGADELAFETRLEAKEVGTFSLAGKAMKFPVIEAVWLVCRGCKAEARGHR